MQWQYRTILFEFQKDGLLGDKYVDDEEVEKVLNEQGDQGWELVSVTTVQEGLLTFFKRMQPAAGQAVARGSQQEPPRLAPPPQPAAPATQPPTGSGQPAPPGEPRPSVQKKQSRIGEIKIS